MSAIAYSVLLASMLLVISCLMGALAGVILGRRSILSGALIAIAIGASIYMAYSVAMEPAERQYAGLSSVSTISERE